MAAPLTLNYNLLAEALLPAVLKAGFVEMQHYAAGVETQTKADFSPVTVADQEAEVILIAALSATAPGIPIIAEEAVAAGRIPEIQDRFFLVDPLDGTREFINKRGEFTVNIALVSAGQPVFGIVYAPALGDLYITLGATTSARAQVAPNAKPASLADYRFQAIHTRKPDPKALTAVASRSHSTDATDGFLAGYAVAKRANSGSSLKFCAIARGDADIYPRLGPTMEWDTAAGHAVLLAAGGTVTKPDGSPFTYGNAAAGYRNSHFVAWGTPSPIEART